MAPPGSRASTSFYSRTASIAHTLTASYRTTTGTVNGQSTSNPYASISNPTYPNAINDDSVSDFRPATGTTVRPGTARPRTGYSTLGVENQEIVCAISESRGVAPTVGLALVNLDTGESVLSQFSDSPTYIKTIHKLMVFNPSTILAVSSSANPKSKLFSIIEENLEEIGSNLTLLDRRYWAETAGMDYIQQLGFPEDVDSIKTAVTGNYYAVCCFAAALKFIELGMAKKFPYHSLRIKYEPSEGSMMIDLATIRSLELVENLQDPRSKDCLLGLLNATLTPMGARLLHSNILQPLTSRETLQTRYDAVEELSTKEELFYSVRQALKPFLDVDRLLTQLILIPVQPSVPNTEQCVNNVIMLKHFVLQIKPVFEALTGSRSEILLEVQKLCAPENTEAVQELIYNTLNEDITYARQPLDLRNQRTYAVKSGVNGLLDVARQTYKESTTDAMQHITDMCEVHNLNFDTKYEAGRQFYLRLSVDELEMRNLPPVFINVYRKGKFVECQTLQLVKLNQKIGDAHVEVLLMSDRLVQDLIANIREHIPGLFKICECIGMLDMLASFAHVVTSQDYCRPVMHDTLAIQDGRHPIREKIQSTTKFIPNNVYATQQARFQIITGCNMSGKSTYIRSVALMTIMAQVGSFVPARYATFPIISQLFARVSMDDNIEANVSTFASEMREAAFILRNIDRSSMVIIDELGRGTSTRDGLAIAIAIAEALIQSRALVWFATHFRDLASILAERNGVVNFHLAVDMSTQNKMEMLYRIASGAVQEDHYGLKLARVVPLPLDVLEHAELVARTLEQQVKKRKQHSMGIIHARRRKLMLNLKEHLIQAKQSEMGDQAMSQWLKDLQREFVIRMDALEQEAKKIERGDFDDTDGDGDDEDAQTVVESMAGTESERHTGTGHIETTTLEEEDDIDADKENRDPASDIRSSSHAIHSVVDGSRQTAASTSREDSSTGRSILGTSSRHFTNSS